MDYVFIAQFCINPPALPLVFLTNLCMCFFSLNEGWEQIWFQKNCEWKLGRATKKRTEAQVNIGLHSVSWVIEFFSLRCIFLLIIFLGGILTLVTRSLNTSSKQCAKVALLNQKSLVFLGCLNCKLLIQTSFFFFVWSSILTEFLILFPSGMTSSFSTHTGWVSCMKRKFATSWWVT